MILWLPVDTPCGVVYVNPNAIAAVEQDRETGEPYHGVLLLTSGERVHTKIEGRAEADCSVCNAAGTMKGPPRLIGGALPKCSACGGTGRTPAFTAAKVTAEAINQALAQTMERLQGQAQTRASLLAGLEGLAPRGGRG